MATATDTGNPTQTTQRCAVTTAHCAVSRMASIMSSTGHSGDRSAWRAIGEESLHSRIPQARPLAWARTNPSRPSFAERGETVAGSLGPARRIDAACPFASENLTDIRVLKGQLRCRLIPGRWTWVAACARRCCGQRPRGQSILVAVAAPKSVDGSEVRPSRDLG